MPDLKRGIKLIGVVILIIIIPSTLFGLESIKKSESSNSKSNFTLTVKNNLISLNAMNASIKDIVEEIGRRMNIDLIANIPEDKKVSIRFDVLSLKDAIERLRGYAGIVYFKDSRSKRITKMMVFPKRKGGELPKSAKEEGSVKTESKAEQTLKETRQPEPFKFEFNPYKYQEGK
ncbi:MAG: hypothetical protein ACM3SR_08640 [Ignavibacteriales bacterium]